MILSRELATCNGPTAPPDISSRFERAPFVTSCRNRSVQVSGYKFPAGYRPSCGPESRCGSAQLRGTYRDSYGRRHSVGILTVNAHTRSSETSLCEAAEEKTTDKEDRTSVENDSLAKATSIFPSEEDSIWTWRRKMLWTILKFIGPALFIPLSDPLMSVVDTVTVGQFSNTTQLAGLGPVTLIFTFVNYIWNSQGIATTSMVASALNNPKLSTEESRLEGGRVLSSSLILAAAAGLTACLGLELLGPALIQVTGAAPELMKPALEYLRVRAFATPATFAIIVSQAALMAQRQSVLPCLVILGMTVLNMGLDVFLIVSYGMGALGAAWATLFSQYVGAGLLLYILHCKSKVKPEWHLPSAKEIAEFGSNTGLLAFIYLCKNICYTCIQRTATALPILKLAAHQPAFMLWNLCAFATQPLEQAALAYYPAAQTRRQKEEIPKLIMATGLMFAVLAGFVSTSIPLFFPQAFSPDARIYPFLRLVAPVGYLAMMAVGMEVAATAILIAKKQYKFIAGAMFRTVLMTAGYVSLVLHYDLGLRGVWFGLFVFYGSCMCQSVPKMIHAVRQELRAFNSALKHA
uniref:Protein DETOXIFICATION n=1 Tax=Tetraselmis sp. GSL018 TaxID=582737 RepID=A0A061S4R5_9CHLO|mmetsp:Transcript_39717/g.94275  ORF Transcript_39717/g.94275 Transcript_39717/m.94275 type:complete len:577 (-) Transcript_39717:165-1895(-)|eukprot:CAMPEP_0177599772 /NCGR_PEP_ID=MMETSP0419_2-20121207/13198_1 /TAXON_ID=582737 /ORGANISM="Tetraselmis sp., Strain GSL018" /LENGTH=576 /DNA_ID=CAMNT_0019092581 /DNA_START=293 /DNA_END=2023 /DNA_ORIENTATION=-